MESEDKAATLENLKKRVMKSKSLDKLEQFQTLSETFLPVYDAVQDNKVSIPYRTNACDTLAIWFTRAIQLLAKDNEFKAQFLGFLTEEKSDFLFHYVIDFWNDSGAALGNALKELFVKMISYLSTILDMEKKNEIFKKWLSVALELPYTMRAFYFMVEHLHKHVQPIDYIFFQKPSFVADCLVNISSRAFGSIVGKCVYLVLRYNYNKDSESQWLGLWQDQVINCLNNTNMRKGIESYLLPNLFQISRSATIKFLRTVIELNDTHILLSALRVAQDSAIVIEPFLEIDTTTNKPLIDIEELSSLLEVSTASYRIGSFQLLVSTPKPSKPIPSIVYKNVINSLDMVFIDSSLETRNDLFAAMKKFILRIKESVYALDRDAKGLTKKNYERFESEIKEKQKSVEKSKDFFIYLLRYIENNLRPGSAYLKKEMACKLLLVLIKSGLDSSVDLKYLEKSKAVGFVYDVSIYGKSLIRLVIDNLLDNYEDIRQYSTEIISMAPLSLENYINMELLQSRALEMLCDIKGKEVDSGARYFKFAFSYYQNKNVIDDKMIKLLLNGIDVSLLKARENLSTACIYNSIQGYFAAFKYIFGVMNFQKCSEMLKTHDILDRLINSSIEIWEIVKKILQHDSPEGIFIEEFQATYTTELEAKYGVGTQVISSYAWRSIKESSNMLDVLLKLKNSPLTDEQVLKIGPLLLEQLATIRHRGAFSSVYPTFISCCSLCTRRCTLVKTPEHWLQENIELIQERSKYITRRSAGIPFLITAILSSNKALVKPAFDKLLAVAKLPVESMNADMDNVNLPQVNAFNCIKAIYVDADLSDESILYVDDAFLLTLNSFASPFWAIRNCAVMLFTALQNRLFSSKKVKANYLPSYPARLFFEKFESIHGLFINTLKEAISKGLENRTEIEKVFPILTIMSRLEPTPGYQGLDEFIPIVIQILDDKTWKVREMAARSLPSMIHNSENFSIVINSLIDNIVSENVNYNQMHGSLIAIKEIITKFMLLSSDESAQAIAKLFNKDDETRTKIISKMNLILDEISCFPIKMSYFQILELLKIDSYKDGQVVIDKLLNWFNENNYLGKHLDGAKQLALKDLSVIIFRNVENEKLFIDTFLLSPLYEVQLSCIQNYNIKLDSSDVDESLKLYLIEKIWELLEKTDCWKYVKSQALKLLRKLIISTNKLESYDEIKVHTEKLFTLLATEFNEDIKLSTVEALGSYIPKLLVFDENKFVSYFDKWMDILKNMISDDLEYVVRIAALKSLMAFNKTYSLYGANEKIKLQIEGFVFEFLTDDDENICQTASDHLTRYVLKKGDQEIVPVEVEKMMIKYFSSITDASLLKSIVGSASFNMYDLKTKFKNIVTGDMLLFSAEKSNLERNPTDKIKELITIINNTPLSSDSKSLSLLCDTLECNLTDIFDYLKCKQITDGCFGLFSSERVFDFIYCQLLLFRCLKQHDIINFSIEPLVEFLQSEKVYCHPLILEVL